MKYKIGDLYFVEFTLEHGDYFKGIVEIISDKLYGDRELYKCKIIKVNKTSNDLWKRDWLFILDTVDLNNKVIAEDYPEYFL